MEFGNFSSGVAARVALSDEARAFARASLAANTRRAYGAQWRLWLTHCDANGLNALPAEPAAVANWLANRAVAGESGGKRRRDGATGQALATLRTALAAIKAAHEAKGIGFDTSAPELRMTLKGIRRERAEKIAKAAPLRAEMLLDVIAGMSSSNPIGGYRAPRDQRRLEIEHALFQSDALS